MDFGITTDLKNLDIEVVKHVLWHFGDPLGQQPGSFTTRLLRAFAVADQTNTSKLAAVYPDYAIAFNAVARTIAGLDELRTIAKKALA